ncbi:DUF3617 domain-containing protein [Rhodoferax antarcticus]|uniref:DUF3617 domain-containing protein n=1 Tax=Rhodoferax antarcticus ANT.BR TaxID=1111071 RepID=A0A1Q8YE57_9BURK|nr:DUF3617 domain-containing protein [Rhodoferax antarcticus]APW46093.1 hypothetical protein RA876_06550 [Rhodoferax antarcticus]MCW2310345.1 hypothetical protein [Rhodoferax antarcticus]OLP06252.1 hypothetical protein BLL52_2483 [Rhodoferax antarcticus ANT.BR]
MKNYLTCVCAAMTVTVPLLMGASIAHAQSTKPGLWEITNKMGGNAQMDSAMAQAQKQMAAMPPDQRKMMQEMMGKQGISMPTVGAGGGVVMKICITPEMAARNEMPNQQEGDCTATITSRTGNSMKAKFVCTDPPTTGEGTYTFSGDTAYTADMKMSTTQNGKPETMTMKGSGKWLSSNCGSVKPIVAPMTKGR